MNSRTPKAAYPQAANSPLTLLLELEMPKTSAFEAFEEQLVARLVKLEERFSDYVTRNSFGGSIGR